MADSTTDPVAHIRWDYNTKRYRNTESGRFATTDEIKSAVREGFAAASTAPRPANADSSAAVTQQLKQIQKQLAQLDRRIASNGSQKRKRERRKTDDLATLIERRIKRQFATLEWQVDLSLMAIASGCILGLIAVQALLQPKQSIVNKVLGTDFAAEVKEGDKILGYTVTSGFGNRTAPKEGASTDHQGVDLDTPTGTSIYAIGNPGETVEVECDEQPEGAGTYATITPETTKDKGITFRAFHLSDCAAGSHPAGSIVAKTGNSGNSTGPHLHWEQQENGNAVPPIKGYLIWALTGSKPASPTNNDFEALKMSIVEQESGGDHTITNVDSGATGKGQVMPENIAAWGEECGISTTVEVFKTDESIQDQIIDCKLEQYWTEAQEKADGDTSLAVRMVASAWYSGDMGLYDSTAPQSGYPSIQAYTLQVLEKYQQNLGVAASGTTTIVTPDNRPPLQRLQARVNELINGKGATTTTTTATSGDTLAQVEAATFKIDMGQGCASGFVIENNGDGTAKALTAAHVTEKGGQLTAVLHDGSKVPITVLEQTSSQTSDVSLIELKGDNLPPAAPMDPDGAETGDQLTKFGFAKCPKQDEPLEKTGTATAGEKQIQSRSVPVVESSDGLVAPGDSGGAVATSQGVVAVVSTGENSEGTGKGWSIAVDQAQKVLDGI